MRFKAALLITALCVASAQSVYAANDGGLYAPPPPADAAYIRVIDPSASAPEEVTLKNVQLDHLPSGIGAYHIVSQGNYEAWGQKLALIAGHNYSLTRKALLEDPVADNPAKALLVFYNLTDKPALTLSTADGKTAIVKDVAPQAEGARAVNAITVSFAASEGAAVLARLPAETLEKGQTYSLVASGAGESITLSLSKNIIAEK